MRLRLLLLSVSVPACSPIWSSSDSSSGPPRSCTPDEPTLIDPAGADHLYAIDRVAFGASAREASGYALDLARDGHPRNTLGESIASLFGGFLDADIQMLIDGGAIAESIDVLATALDDADHVGVTMTVGGGAAAAPGHISGRIVAGRLDVDLGAASVAVAFPGLAAPFVIPLAAAQIEATIDGDGIDGQLGGVIAADQIASALVPAVDTGLLAQIASDCPHGACAPGSLGAALVSVFDTDHDGTVTLQELQDAHLIELFLEPDLDLFDAQGRYDPGCDLKLDGLSVAVHFHASAVVRP